MHHEREERRRRKEEPGLEAWLIAMIVEFGS
jgi:hypothetical protein